MESFLLVVPSKETTGKDQKWMYRKFYRNMKKKFTVGVTDHYTRLPQGVAGSPSKEIFKSCPHTTLSSML